MDPIVESQPLFHWQAIDLPAELAADPSLRQLQEARLREGSSFQIQSGETQRFLADEAVRISTALTAPMGVIRFQFPRVVIRQGERKGESFTAEVPEEFRQQIVAGFLSRLPLKDARTAFRIRLSQLEDSGYAAVRIAAGLLRFAVVRQIVHAMVPEDGIPAPRMKTAEAGTTSASPEEGKEPAPDFSVEALPGPDFIQAAEAAILQLRAGMNTLNQAVSLAPYMYADAEYQIKRAAFLTRLMSCGHALAHRHVREIVRTIRRRAEADDLNRGLRLSVPYFDDRALEMKLREFEVIPPGRTMFVPAFVALAAAREQETIDQEISLSPSTRVHLLAELKSLEQAFDSRPR